MSTLADVIDVTLITASVSNLFVGWKVSDEETLSDHRQIEFYLCSGAAATSTLYRNLRKVDWSKFTQVLSEAMKVSPDQSLSVDNAVNDLQR